MKRITDKDRLDWLGKQRQRLYSFDGKSTNYWTYGDVYAKRGQSVREAIDAAMKSRGRK